MGPIFETDILLWMQSTLQWISVATWSLSHKISVSAPVDNVLMSYALGFPQGLYPPVGPTSGQQTLRNGTIIEAPLNGYQLILIATVGGASGTNKEDAAFLQSTTGCTGAITSSNE